MIETVVSNACSVREDTMGESEWRLTATGITLLALLVTGFQLVRCIWRGYPVKVRRYRSILVAELAVGLALAWPAPAGDETAVAGAFERADAAAMEALLGRTTGSASPCSGTASVIGYVHHGERLLVTGTGDAETACGVWAIVEDVRGGGLWLQGPVKNRAPGWELDLVLGTDGPTAEELRYRVSLVVVSGST